MRITEIFLRYLKRPKGLVGAMGAHGFLNWLSDSNYLHLLYYCETGYKLDLKNPKRFTEKLQWLKLFDRKDEYTGYVDKYIVRTYVTEKIGEKYLIPMFEVYDNIDAIKWGELPNKFVLKCTHGSHSNIICNDKKKLDINKSYKKLEQWMTHNWFWFGREWPYKNVRPRIICEKFLEDEKGACIIPDDYKVMCFNGKAKLIQVHKDRFGDNHTQDIYNTDWVKTDLNQVGCNISKEITLRPNTLEKMLVLSEKLAINMKHIRIDWYLVNEKLYFGEITFFDASGFEPFVNEKDELEIGSWIDLYHN